MAKTYVAMGHEQCPVCGEKHNGTPMTKCGLDMTYSGTYVKRTEIKKTGV